MADTVWGHLLKMHTIVKENAKHGHIARCFSSSSTQKFAHFSHRSMKFHPIQLMILQMVQRIAQVRKSDGSNL